jgi:hypothetical protein
MMYAAMGLIAGTLCALGGALKDSPYEGFKPLTFLRSPLVGLAAAFVAVPLTDNPLLILAVAGSVERLVVEGWKILRRQKPGKFGR